MRTRFAESIRLAELVPIGAFFVLYLLIDRLTGVLSRLTADDIARRSLVVAAVDRRALWWIGVAVSVALIAVVSPAMRRRAIDRWSELEHGAILRLLATPLIGFLAWEAGLAPFNVHAGELHLLDRGILVVLAAAALWRPVFLIPFALQFRVVSAQAVFPFQTTAGQNINELPVLVLLLVAVGHLLFVLSGRRSTSLVVLGVGAALASHFYIPGKGKLLMGWLTGNDVANLPLSAYTAGWLGHTDGSIAATVSAGFERFAPVVRFATIALELGSLLAVAHRRLLRPWLLGAVAFHVVTFISTGFFFASWILVEVGLLIILSRGDLRSWVEENASWPRAAAAVGAVIAAPVLFHPPGLAWIDAPVSYGYRLEAVGDSGTTYRLPAWTFAPLEHEIMFKRLQFAGPAHMSGAYGALGSAERLDELNEIEDLADLSALEAAQAEPDPAVREASVELLTDFMVATHDDDIRATTRWLHRLNAPSLFWSSWSPDDYHFEEPLDRIDVTLLTRLHNPARRDNDTVLSRTDPVLSVSRQPDGVVEVRSFER